MVEWQLPKLYTRVRFPSPAYEESKIMKRAIMRWRYLVYVFFILLFAGCETVPYQPPPTAAIPKAMPGIYHEISPGETLWRISQTYGLEVADIVRVNGLSDATKIKPGQRLFIPGAKATLIVSPEKAKLYEKDFFIWPVDGEIVSYFNQEVFGTRNKGIDIKAAQGTPVVASKGGKVVFCSDSVKGLGKVIILNHLDGFSTVYARNSQNLVKAGDSISQNQVIAKAGSSGRGAAPYLHFEVRRGHKPQNPLYYLP